MAFVHSKNTYISLDSNDLSPYVSESEFSRDADTHDVTTYGKTSKVYQGGLKDAKFTMKGVYDATTAGPHDKIIPLIGTTVSLVRRVEGTGSGKPQTTVDVVVKSYVETSPVNDMVKWSCDCQCSEDITETDQV